MEGTLSPVPSPPAAAPSPPLDEDDFGVRPARECGGSYTPSTLPTAAASYIEVIQNNTKEIPTEPTSHNIDQSIPSHSSTSNPSVSSYVPHYDPSHTNAYQAITSMQQLQQAWSTAGVVDSYATMSMSIPNLSFMQQFQQPSMPIMSTGYGVSLQPPPLQSPYGNIGYETFQPSQQDHQSSPPLPPQDLAAIPLPPGPNPQPPPPLPQEAPPEQSNMYSTPQPPPPPGNPFETEYDPLYPQHSFNPEPAGYDPAGHQYNSLPSPNDMSQQRYHPYNNNQSPRGRHSSGLGNQNNNSNSNRYSSNNTSPTGSQILPLISADLSPMERFSQSLGKNRNSNSNSQPILESPVNSVGDWSALKKEEIPQSNFVQSQNPYFMNNSFSDYDENLHNHLQDGK